MDLRLRRRVNSVQAVAAGQRPSDESTATVDLSGLTFIRPGPLVAVASWMWGRLDDGQQLVVLLPNDQVAVRYLEEQSGFCWFFSTRGDVRFENRNCSGDFGYSVADSLVAMSRVARSQEVEDRAHEMFESFGRLQGPTGRLIHDLDIGLAEPANNAVEHSGARGGGVCMAQTYRARITNRVAEVAVADCGRGIRASLRARRPDLASDVDAIQAALVEGVTCLDDPHRGLGLAATADLVTYPKRLMTIMSGDGCVVITPKGRHPSTLSKPWPGTVVVLDFPMPR